MVNVFVIKPNIYETARLLDDKRLGKQRVEAKQIINALEEFDLTGRITKAGWSNHPAVKSWIGFTNHLKVYFNIIVREWCSRGFNNTMQLYPIDERPYNIVNCNFDGRTSNYDRSQFNQYSFPFWISFPPFYLSHQASLCRKDPKYYKSLLCDTLNPYLNYGYIWPCNVNSNCYIDWNFSYHEDLATSGGCPPVYKLSVVDILEWMNNPYINPKTGRQLTNKSQIYLDYCDAMKSHRLSTINTNEGPVILLEGRMLCHLNNIRVGMMYVEQFYYSNGGIPNAMQLVYKFANN